MSDFVRLTRLMVDRAEKLLGTEPSLLQPRCPIAACPAVNLQMLRPCEALQPSASQGLDAGCEAAQRLAGGLA